MTLFFTPITRLSRAIGALFFHRQHHLLTLALVISVLPSELGFSQAWTQGYNWERLELQSQHDAADLEEARALVLNRGVLVSRNLEANAGSLNSLMQSLSASDPYAELVGTTVGTAAGLGSDAYGYGMKLFTHGSRLMAFVRDQSPASEAGLRGGYEVLEINSSPVTAVDFQIVSRELRSESPEVRFLLAGLDNGDLRDIMLKKQVYPATGTQFTRHYGLPFVHIVDFRNAQTKAEIIEHLRETSPTEHLVIDLRFSTGGDLLSAFEVAELFVEANSLLGSVVTSDGRETVYSTSSDNRAIHTGPLTVVTSESTASTAEAFIRSLVSNRAVSIIGLPTAGKCFGQTTFTLSSGRKLRFSTGLIFGPARSACSPEGIVPDADLGPDVVFATYEVARRSQLLQPSPANHNRSNTEITNGVGQLETSPDAPEYEFERPQ